MISVQGFITTAEGVNTQGGLVNIFCATSLPFGYCVSPTDSIAFQITEPVVALESIILKTEAQYNGNKIEWMVSFDEDISIQIEKSSNGVDYYLLHEYQSPDSDFMHNYMDMHLTSEISYYRLVILHLDGKISYSDVQSLVNKSIHEMGLASNVVSQYLEVVGIDSNDSRLNSEIFSVSGYRLGSHISPDNRIDVSTLTPGIYFLQLENTGKKQTIKFIKH